MSSGGSNRVSPAFLTSKIMIATPRVVLFDLDDTLFAHTDAVAKGLARHLHLSGCSAPAIDHNTALTRWRELEELHYHSHLLGKVGFQEQRRLRARDFASDFGICISGDLEADAWFDGFLVKYRQAWALYDDVIPTLDSLVTAIPGVKFGIITNGEKELSLDKLNTLDLDKWIEHTIISGEIGVTKPDRRIFEHACNMFSVAPCQGLYVGDRLHTDAIGAHEAGLRGLWLNRSDSTESVGQYTASISSIRSLTELLILLVPRRT
jgi:putative hydrolase of the HAD superfamily